MLRVGIIGCGKVADQHAEHILSIPGCRVVGVCDREELMAQQLQERLNAEAAFTSVEDLLQKAKPDVAHITTPPQSHYPIAKLCLESGCAVYVEKPFTIDAHEAEELIRIAERTGVKLTVGHNQQFSHAAQRMRQLVRDGYLGGPPVHIESYDGYSFGDAIYAKAVLGDGQHWVRKLPGGLLQNNMSHGISKIAEFLQGDAPVVVAYGFTSPLLRSVGETDIVDELRVIIHDDPITAYYTFSSQMRPVLEEVRLYGPENGLVADTVQQTVVKLRGTAYKSFLEQFVPPWGYAKQYVGNFGGNVRRFAKADFHADHGKRFLIQAFYRSIAEGAPLPITYKEILLTARIMDDVFAQLDASRAERMAGSRRSR